MSKFNDYLEFKDWYSGIEAVYGEDTGTYMSQLVNTITTKKTPLNMAKGAFLSIYGDLKESNESVAIKLYKSVYEYAPREPTTNVFEYGKNLFDTREIERTFFPSSIEDSNLRAGHVHLVSFGHKSGRFAEGSMTRLDIAKEIYTPYAIADVGGKENLSFTLKELKKNNMTIDMVTDGLPYLMKHFEKQGHKLVPWTLNKYGDFTIEERMNPDTIHILLETLRQQEGWSDATMWAAYRRSEDGKGMEVTLNAGHHGSGNFETVGVWKYVKDDGEVENLIFSEDEMWKLLKSAWNTHYMDAENDFWEMSHGGSQLQDTLKEKMEYWYNQGEEYTKEDGTKSRRYAGSQGGSNYVAIPKWGIEIMNPKAYEYENIIVRFWEEHGHKSDAEFEKAWEDELRNNTYNFEDRHMQWWKRQFRGLIAPPGSLPGYGAVSQSFAGSIIDTVNPFD